MLYYLTLTMTTLSQSVNDDLDELLEKFNALTIDSQPEHLLSRERVLPHHSMSRERVLTNGDIMRTHISRTGDFSCHYYFVINLPEVINTEPIYYNTSNASKKAATPVDRSSKRNKFAKRQMYSH